MKKKIALLLLILFSILLVSCSNTDQMSETEVEVTKVEVEPEAIKENILGGVNLDYISWHINHKDALYNTLINNSEFIETYQKDSLLSSIATLEILVGEARSKEFADPLNKLKPIHTQYKESLDSIDKVIQLSAFVFNENGSINEEQYKAFRASGVEWTSDLVLIANDMVPYEGIYYYTNFISDSPSPDNYDKRAGYFEMADLKEEALKDYKVASELLPESSYLKKKVEEISQELGIAMFDENEESSLTTNEDLESDSKKSTTDTDALDSIVDTSKKFAAANNKLFIKGITIDDEKNGVIEKWGAPEVERIDEEYNSDYTILEYGQIQVNIYEDKVDSIYMDLEQEVFESEFLARYSGEKYISQDGIIYFYEPKSNQLLFFKEENGKKVLILVNSDGNFDAGVNDGYIKKMK